MLRRRKRRFLFKIIFPIVAFSFLIIGFIVGYYRTLTQGERERPFADKNSLQLQENTDELRKNFIVQEQEELSFEDKDDEAVTYHEDSITETTNIIYKTFYDICKDTMEESLEADHSIIGLNEAGLKEYLKDKNLLFEIQNFSTKEVILVENKNTACPAHYNHYLISEANEFIAIYHIDEKGDKVLIEKTLIPISILPNVDQEKLKKGILKTRREDVYQLLEDYSS